MTQALLAVGGLFIVVYGPIAVLALKRPLLARFAFRESIRRPGQLIFLVVSLMSATASITACLVAADSFAQAPPWSWRLGAVDLSITAPTGRSFPIEVARHLSADPALAPYVDGLQPGLEVTASVADVDQRLGKPGTLVVGFDPAAQKRFGPYQLTDGRRVYGRELNPGEVLLSHQLATSLDARPGDHLRARLPTGREDLNLRVFGVAVASGPGAYGGPLVVFTPLETAQNLTGDSGINVIRIAARGGTPDDAGPASQAAAALRTALGRTPDAGGLTVNELRADALLQTEGAVAFVLGTTLGFSLLTVLAAVAVIVNLVIALSEERRPQLAVMRALGLSRGGLVLLSVLEGAIYSLVAAAVALPIGLGAAVFLTRQLVNAYLQDPNDQLYQGYPLSLSLRPVPLAIAFAAGSLITLATVGIAAYRTSRMTIAAAVRDLPEPAHAVRRPWPRRLALLGLGLIGVALLIPDDPRTRLVGGALLITTIVAASRGRLSDRARTSLAGTVVAAWTGINLALTQPTSDLGKWGFVVVMSVILASAGLSVAAASILRSLDRGVGLLGSRLGRVQAALRPPLAYLSRRPVRTGLATTAFGLVLALVTLIAIAVAPQKIDYWHESAGFDIVVVTSGGDAIRLPPDVSSRVTDQVTLPMRLYQGSLQASGLGGNGSYLPVLFYVLPDEIPDRGPAILADRQKRFRTDADAWRAVESAPGLVAFTWGAGLVPGDEVKVKGVNGPLTLTVAGSMGSTVLGGGVAASAATVSELNTQPVGATVLLRTAPGADPRTLAREIERSLFAEGVQATPTREIIDLDHATNLNYTTEYDVLLHMGLLVGVLALTMVGIRAAIERRRAIGILRALGYQPGRLIAGMLVESLLRAMLGVVIGVVSAVLIALFLAVFKVQGSSFAIDLPRLLVAIAIVIGTVVLVSVPLASRMSRMLPTDAIRTTG